MPARTDQEIARDAAQIDSGFRNPNKIKFAGEARSDAVEELVERGYSPGEAEQMIRDEE